jgi:hypothetical protein
MAAEIRFDDAENPGKQVSLEANPQTAVSPGTKAGTAIVNTPDGRRLCVVGDYREVEAKLQAAAARAHESGDAIQQNTPVS